MITSMIDPSETAIVGSWISDQGEVRGDRNCLRIEELTSEYLVKLAVSPVWGEWETLFRDPVDGRYWERVFPQSDMHGGGPPSLLWLDSSVAVEKYKLK